MNSDRPRHPGLPIALWAMLVVGLTAAGCRPKPELTIESPLHGALLESPTVTVSGRVRGVEAASLASFSVNGVPATLPPDREYSVEVPLDADAIFNPIVVELTTVSGRHLRERVVVLAGDGAARRFVLDGERSPESVGLRLSDDGLDQLAPLINSLSGEALDVRALVTGGNPIAQGSSGGVSYTANAVDVSVGGLSLSADAAAGGLGIDLSIAHFFLEIDLELSLLGACSLEVWASQVALDGVFEVVPLAADPTFVDVDLISPVEVGLAGFGSQFVSGACNDPITQDIVNANLSQAQIEQIMRTGFAASLADPDGAGPADSPLAAAIQEALVGISISGPVGEALGGLLDAPLAQVSADADGLTAVADAAFVSSAPHPDAPDLPGSYAVEEAVPTFGPLTPAEALPYGLGLAISTTALNQLLAMQIEGGLLRQELESVGPISLTAGFLAVFVPELASYPPETTAVMQIRPTLAPLVTGEPGPEGELAELRMAALEIELLLPEPALSLLTLDMDFVTGLDLVPGPEGLAFIVTPPAPEAITLRIIENPLQTDEATLLANLQLATPLLTPALTGAVEPFPLPQFLGMELQPVEVARIGEWIGLFVDLVELPAPHIENVVVANLSAPPVNEQGGCWLKEWRHRVASSHASRSIDANLKAVLGADAGCTTNDASIHKGASFRVDFDVVAVPGEPWTLEIDHWIHGAFDRISDGYNDGIGFQDGGGDAYFVTDVSATWSVSDGTSGSFGFTATPFTMGADGIGGPSTTQDVPFSGSNGVVLTRSGDLAVQVQLYFEVRAHSDSNTAFPVANGDEVAIRLGKNDTIDANFTAGSYPGFGSRNIADDGHFLRVELSGPLAP